MVDRETVINCLQQCDGRAIYMGHGCEKCSYLDGTERKEKCIEHLHTDILAILREQEPVKPIYEFGGITRCGACNSEIDKFDGDKYCHSCGRKVKWE